MKELEAVVIGAGPGGYVAAIRLAQYGKKAAVIEKGEIGGVCLNVGCIPSKALIHASEVYASLEKGKECGIEASGLKVDFKKTQAWKNEVVQKLTGGIGQLLKAYKIERIAGTARFKGKNELTVEGKEGSESVRFGDAIIAVGSSPLILPGFEPDGKIVGTSTDALSYPEIPETLCVIGGGYIGLEIGSFYAAFGCRVTVIEATVALLPGVDPDLVRSVAKELKKRGVEVLLETKALKWRPKGKGAEVEWEGKKGKGKTAAEKILVAVGRVPNTKGLAAEKAGVFLDAKGFIHTDERMKTGAGNIYAIGDCATGPMLAHKASKEGLVAAAVIAGKNEIQDARGIPAVVFTTPEIATVGLSEREAREKGLKIKIGRFPFLASGKALSSGETEGMVKIIADAETDLLLGVGIAGANASNLIGEACLALEMGACAEDLARTIHPHPTLTETLMEAAESLHGMAIHITQRSPS